MMTEIRAHKGMLLGEAISYLMQDKFARFVRSSDVTYTMDMHGFLLEFDKAANEWKPANSLIQFPATNYFFKWEHSNGLNPQGKYNQQKNLVLQAIESEYGNKERQLAAQIMILVEQNFKLKEGR